MNKEIKEITNYMQEYIKPFNHDSEPMLNSEDIKVLLDYIINLQEENNHLDKVNCHLRKNINNNVYKLRVDKALKIIEQKRGEYDIPDELEKILKGENENER